MSKNIKTPEFRVSYPSVFEPSGMEGKEPKYRIAMLFDKGTDISELQKAVQDAIELNWPDIKTRPSNLKKPFRDGDVEKPGIPGYENTFFAAASSKQKPGLVDASLRAIIDTHEFYPGCYARASVTAFAYSVKGNVGVALGLQNIQKTREGDPFSGRVPATSEFEVINKEMGLDEQSNYESIMS